MFKVGSLVRLKVWCLGNDVGTIGVCYEVYNFGDYTGYSFIFENGNYDGFSPEECDRFLKEIGRYPLIYTFENVIKLDRDFRNGLFESVFNLARTIQ